MVPDLPSFPLGEKKFTPERRTVFEPYASATTQLRLRVHRLEASRCRLVVGVLLVLAGVFMMVVGLAAAIRLASEGDDTDLPNAQPARSEATLVPEGEGCLGLSSRRTSSAKNTWRSVGGPVSWTSNRIARRVRRFSKKEPDPVQPL